MTDFPPMIGLTADWQATGEYSRLPWYVLRENYVTSVVRAGGVPLILPHETALATRMMDVLDGLLVTGGDFDVDPAYYGADKEGGSREVNGRRTAYEGEVVQIAMDRSMPVLGICGGQQLVNVVLGGSLIQHIPDEHPAALPHEQPNPRTEPGHEVTITPDTLLSRIVGTKSVRINSAHHQAIKTVGKNAIVNALAPDGIIEGIEAVDKPFCLGVQWHPEYAIDPGDEKLFTAFIAAAADYAGHAKNRS